MDYVEAVTVAASALRLGEASNWELARLTWTWTRTGTGRPGNTLSTEGISGVSMANWCADLRQATPGLKFSDQTGQRYKRIWEMFGTLEPPERPSWTDAFEAAVPSATKSDTYRRHADAHLREAAPERKRELLVRLLNDPALADLEVLDRMAALLTSRRRELRGMPPVPAERPLEEEEAAAASDPYGVSVMLRLALYMLDGRDAAQHFAETLRRHGAMNEDQRSLVRGDLAKVVEAWQQLDAVVAGGSVSSEIEEFLAAHRVAAEPSTD